MKIKCCECRNKKPAYRAVVKQLDGTVDYACYLCWARLGLGMYMNPEGEE